MSLVQEKVEFRITGDRDEFVTLFAEVGEWSSAQPGFVRRTLAVEDDGLWIDMVVWQSMDAAKAAGEKFMAELAGSPFMAMIDVKSVSTRHAPVVVMA